jgi:hypothetical protein
MRERPPVALIQLHANFYCSKDVIAFPLAGLAFPVRCQCDRDWQICNTRPARLLFRPLVTPTHKASRPLSPISAANDAAAAIHFDDPAAIRSRANSGESCSSLGTPDERLTGVVGRQ